MFFLVIITLIYIISFISIFIGMVSIGINVSNSRINMSRRFFCISIFLNTFSLLISFFYSNYIGADIISFISAILVCIYFFIFFCLITSIAFEGGVFFENIKPKKLKKILVSNLGECFYDTFTREDFKYYEKFQRKIKKGINKNNLIKEELISLKMHFKNDEFILDLIDNLLVSLED